MFLMIINTQYSTVFYTHRYPICGILPPLQGVSGGGDVSIGISDYARRLQRKGSPDDVGRYLDIIIYLSEIYL